MTIDLRKTGISVVGDIPWGTHFCYFYETKQDLLDTLVPYFKAGLESKDFCLWVVSNSDLITVEEAKAALEQAVPDLDRHFSDRNIEILNRDEWYLEENEFNLEKVTSAWDAKLKQVLALGYDGMRVSGDTFWLGEKFWKDFCVYEKQLNDSITDQSIIVLCTYPLAKSGAAEILDVVQSHQFALARRQGEWKVIAAPELLQAKAEIKRLNEELQRVVEQTSKPHVILSYGVAVLSVTAALIITLWLRMELGQQFTPIVAMFLCAVMFSAWFGGIKSGLLAIALALLAFVYYFVTPFYSLAVDIKEIPRLIIFALSALFVGSLSAAQRGVAVSLGRARDVLDGTVQELKRTNEALQAEIAERKQAEERLRATTEQLRALSARVQSAREEEGARIAREIHDELGAALSSLRWDLEDIVEVLSATPEQSQLSALRKKSEAMIRLSDSTIDTVRRIASELRPIALDQFGLTEAVKWHAQQFQERTGIIVNCDCPLEDRLFNPELSTDVFRIFQEALTNILRHAQATRVDISMEESEGCFVMKISDNGRGITEDEKSSQHTLGLLGMRERAHFADGSIDISGSDEKGTVVTVRIPISGQANNSPTSQ